MGTDTRITVDGVEVDPAGDIAQAVAEAQRERPPAVRHLLIEDGTPTGEVMWDGVTPYDPGEGVTLTPTAEWQGEAWTGPPETEDNRVRRTRGERLDALIDHLIEDRQAFDGFTAAQRQAAQKRALRALILLIREVRADTRDDEG